MSDRVMTDVEVAQAFADQLDKISLRTRRDGSGHVDRLRQIIQEHEAMCVALEKAEAS